MKTWTFTSSKLAWENKAMSTPAKVVWHVLAGYRNHETGEAYPSEYTIGQITGYGRRTVHKAVLDLEKAGILTKRQQKLEGGLWSHNVYTVAITPGQLHLNCKDGHTTYGMAVDGTTVSAPQTVSQLEAITQKNITGSASAEQGSFEGIKAIAEAVIEAEGLRIPDPETVIESLMADRNSGKISSAAIAGRLRKISELVGW